MRAIRELRPRFALFENVPGLFSSNGGRFFNRILTDLAESGYDAEWQVLSAAEVGAWHRRERVWITAYPGHLRRRNEVEGVLRTLQKDQCEFDTTSGPSEARNISYPVNGEHRGRRGQNREANGIQEINRATVHAGEFGGTSEVSYPSRNDANRDTGELSQANEQQESERQEERLSQLSGAGDVSDAESTKREQSGDSRNGRNGFADGGDNANPTSQRLEGQEPTRELREYFRLPAERDWWATEPNLGELVDGLSTPVDLELREIGIRVATHIPERVNQLKGLGNAIVPQCAAVIMQKIKESM